MSVETFQEKLEDVKQLPKGPKGKIIRTYDNCYEKAKECNFDLKEFRTKYSCYYKAYRRYNYNIPLTRSIKESGYWTYERCKSIVEKYDLIDDLIKDNLMCYHTISRNNWQHLIKYLKKKHKPSHYWDYFDNCYEEALKYKIKSEFRSNSKACYDSCKLNDWLSIVCQHMISTQREVYVLEFPDNIAYVGLTINFTRRYRDHKGSRGGYGLKELIEKYDPKIIRSQKMDEIEAVKLEIKLISQYKNNGWELLNRNKGGSIGGKRPNYTKEECKLVALNYMSRTDFKKLNASVYVFAGKLGWINDICKHMPYRPPLPISEREFFAIFKVYGKKYIIKNLPKVNNRAIKKKWYKNTDAIREKIEMNDKTFKSVPITENIK